MTRFAKRLDRFVRRYLLHGEDPTETVEILLIQAAAIATNPKPGTGSHTHHADVEMCFDCFMRRAHEAYTRIVAEEQAIRAEEQARAEERSN